MTEYTQEYLNTLSKEQRGELWIQGVLAKQPDYNVQDLKDIWAQTENTHETYEQEADKLKWLSDELDSALNSGYTTYETFDDMIKDINAIRTEVYAEVKAELKQEKMLETA